MPRPERPRKRRANLLRQEGVDRVDWKNPALLRKYDPVARRHVEFKEER